MLGRNVVYVDSNLKSLCVKHFGLLLYVSAIYSEQYLVIYSLLL